MIWIYIKEEDEINGWYRKLNNSYKRIGYRIWYSVVVRVILYYYCIQMIISNINSSSSRPLEIRDFHEFHFYLPFLLEKNFRNDAFERRQRGKGDLKWCGTYLMLIRYCASATDSGLPVIVIVRSIFPPDSRSSQLEIRIMAPLSCLKRWKGKLTFLFHYWLLHPNKNCKMSTASFENGWLWKKWNTWVVILLVKVLQRT